MVFNCAGAIRDCCFYILGHHGAQGEIILSFRSAGKLNVFGIRDAGVIISDQAFKRSGILLYQISEGFR